MNIGELRDLIIIIWGIIGIIALTVISILMTVMMLAFYRHMRPLIDALQVTLGKVDATVSKVQEILDYTSDNVVKPLIHLAAVIQGASRGFRIIEKIFKRGGER